MGGFMDAQIKGYLRTLPPNQVRAKWPGYVELMQGATIDQAIQVLEHERARRLVEARKNGHRGKKVTA